MVHKLTQLNTMSEDQLHSLAEELGLKVSKKASIEDVKFQILDKEAEIASKEPLPEKKKRGRPKKNEAVAEKPQEQPKEAAKPAEPKPAEQPKAKAKKQNQEPTPAPAEKAPVKNDVVARAAAKMAAKKEAENAPVVPPAPEKQPAKRGRKPRVKEETPNLFTEDMPQNPAEVAPSPLSSRPLSLSSSNSNSSSLKKFQQYGKIQ